MYLYSTGTMYWFITYYYWNLNGGCWCCCYCSLWSATRYITSNVEIIVTMVTGITSSIMGIARMLLLMSLLLLMVLLSMLFLFFVIVVIMVIYSSRFYVLSDFWYITPLQLYILIKLGSTLLEWFYTASIYSYKLISLAY